MIDRQKNPKFLNSFLDYSMTILNKSPNTIKEYNYDLTTFFRYIKLHFKLTKEEEFQKIDISDITIRTLKRIELDDLHSYLSYLTTVHKNKPATRARKIASIKTFFNYMTITLFVII